MSDPTVPVPLGPDPNADLVTHPGDGWPTALDRLAAKLRMQGRWQSGYADDPPPHKANAEPIPPRELLYNPHLDPGAQHSCTDEDGKRVCPPGGPLIIPDEEHPGNLVTSRLIQGGDTDRHAPVLDVDIPMQVVLSPSGNAHLYFPTLRLEWEAYVKLLVALSEAGIISPNWMAACARDGRTMVRVPGATKFNRDNCGISEL